MRAQMRRLAEKAGTFEPWSFERVIASFPSDRRKKYQLAYDSLQVDPLDYRDATISAFVKAEKINPEEKSNPDPRMIQARDPRYNLVIAKYLRPVEHFIYNMVDKFGFRMVAKGLNQLDRATVLKEKLSVFEDPICFSIDASRWDKHVSKKVLEIEHAFYQKCVPDYPEFDRLLKWQLRNNVRTSTGIKYVCDGGRMSGDINTALGNCLLMVIMVKAAMKKIGVGYTLFDDGDDCLVIVERKDFNITSTLLPKIFLTYGQELKIENVADTLRSIVFCQSRVCNNGLGDVFIRDWRKVLSNACCGTKNWNDPNLVRPMMGLVGRCELALNRGVPILQAFALALLRISGGKTASLDKFASTGLVCRIKYEFGGLDNIPTDALPITDEARLAFEEAFDTPIWEQLEVERILSCWTLRDVKAHTVGDEWGLDWFDQREPSVLLPPLY